jgi:two-component system phosphate regulon response regulator PhoB
MGPDQHILFVEDNAATRECLAVLLEGAGYVRTGAGNGRLALDSLRQAEPPLVILLDLRVSVMGGWQFRREQRHDPALALIPVVLAGAGCWRRLPTTWCLPTGRAWCGWPGSC